MKKIQLFLSMLLLSSLLVFGGTIVVTSPTGSSNWVKGTTHTITWTSSGCTDSNVKINIFRNSPAEANFVEQLTCTGCSSKSWTIPPAYTDGNYVIRVKTADNSCVGDSPVFVISSPPAATITVTNPPSPNATWQHAKTYPIIWQKTGTLQTDLKIDLLNASGNAIVTNLYSNVSKTANSKNWTPPISIPHGPYRIKVSTTDGQVSGKSAQFSIITNPAIPYPATYQGMIAGPAATNRVYRRSNTGPFTPAAKPKFMTIRINNAFYTENMSTPYGDNANPLKIAITGICTSPLEYKAVVYMSNINVAAGQMFLMHDSGWKDSNNFSIIIPSSSLSQVSSSPLPMWYGGQINLYIKNKSTGEQATKDCNVKFTW